MRRKTIVRLGGATLGLVALLLGGSAMAAEPEKPSPVLVAKVTRVNDGDSIEVELELRQQRGCGSRPSTRRSSTSLMARRSSAALKAMLPVGSTVELEVVTQDSFNRMVATVWLVANGKRTNLNEAMLRDGHAWAYRRYMKDPKYCDIEQEARASKAGLWAQPVSDWVYPPEWRYLKNGEIRVAARAVRGDARDNASPCSGMAGKGTYATAEMIMGTFLFFGRRTNRNVPLLIYASIFLADSTVLARSSGVGGGGTARPFCTAGRAPTRSSQRLRPGRPSMLTPDHS